jgi:hypothetical protein
MQESICFFFLVVLEFELKVPCLLGWQSHALSPSLFAFYLYALDAHVELVLKEGFHHLKYLRTLF